MIKTIKCKKCRRVFKSNVLTIQGNNIMDVGINKEVWLCNRCIDRMPIHEVKYATQNHK